MDVEYDGSLFKDTMASDITVELLEKWGFTKYCPADSIRGQADLSERKRIGAELGRSEYRVESKRGFGYRRIWKGCHVFECMNMDIAHPFKDNAGVNAGDTHILRKPASAERTVKPLLTILLMALTDCSGYVREASCNLLQLEEFEYGFIERHLDQVHMTREPNLPDIEDDEDIRTARKSYDDRIPFTVMYLDHTFGKRSELWSLKPPKEELDPGGNTFEIFFLFTTESWTTTTTAFAQALRNSDCIANLCVKCSGYSMHEFFSGQLLERQQVDIFSFSQHLHQ
mmetsp:Transcript_22091/g.33585  ORF Transcript_22091/g.33585 Transcript_22091/m.33585 type:complete len:284 (+) Transcript_22091:1557-2408(+)